jgi:hypothetical protein
MAVCVVKTAAVCFLLRFAQTRHLAQPTRGHKVSPTSAHLTFLSPPFKPQVIALAPAPPPPEEPGDAAALWWLQPAAAFQRYHGRPMVRLFPSPVAVTSLTLRAHTRFFAKVQLKLPSISPSHINSPFVTHSLTGVNFFTPQRSGSVLLLQLPVSVTFSYSYMSSLPP